MFEQNNHLGDWMFSVEYHRMLLGTRRKCWNYLIVHQLERVNYLHPRLDEMKKFDYSLKWVDRSLRHCTRLEGFPSGQPLASIPGRAFSILTLGRKQGLVSIAWVLVHLRN